ncbi:NAD(P)-binding Rossmann-fold containing protein [Glarea lozoyensis ATCC 20868]|uniref:NAD(P)-binding Rossmann-fold containing protein n=1 Tax=Glarea lozoyensis (strain ATCC 20868 / MF5171) TaxID=1116229 RepID=S3DXZ0_GLAL2|nr:NAD(P)-binding Rossmann-fold containing protein [Glarea lozoyensis ATCC 20868]EPE31218.1 NAD(P)-binding Rossmann-fold containing protein [Glarea lozoyensis ATCC 20868]
MASPVFQRVIVLGAGGSLGPAILKALARHFEVSILTRKCSTSSFAPTFKVVTIADDYPTAELLEAFKNQDVVVCLMSPWACESQKQIIDAAVKAGVKRFIPAEFAYDSTNANAIKHLPALQIRANIVTHLQAQESKGLTWTAFITGPFLDWCLLNGRMGFDVVNREAMIFDQGDQPFSTSTLALIGDAVARALLQPEATQNRRLFVSSVTTTQNKILAALQKHSKEPWKTTSVESRTKVDEANEMFKTGGDPVEAFKFLIMAVQYGANTGSDFSGRDSNELLGLVHEDLDEIVQRVLDD